MLAPAAAFWLRMYVGARKRLKSVLVFFMRSLSEEDCVAAPPLSVTTPRSSLELDLPDETRGGGCGGGAGGNGRESIDVRGIDVVLSGFTTSDAAVGRVLVASG